MNIEDWPSGIGMADDHAGLAALQTYYLLPAQVSYARACLLPPPSVTLAASSEGHFI